jgi:hypothetical protein
LTKLYFLLVNQNHLNRRRSIDRSPGFGIDYGLTDTG